VEVDGRLLGTRGDVGFFSLGRGKNVTSGSGGIVVTDSDEIGGRLRTIVAELPAAGAADEVVTFLTLAALSVFVSPGLYWLPAGLPFLRLGETIFHEDFPVRGFSSFRASLLRHWPARLHQLNAARRRAADFYVRNIEGAQEHAPNLPYLRFPLSIEHDEARRRILDEGDGRLLGIGRMYPGSVGAIPQLQGRLARKSFPEAERRAASLLTLPTHPLLSEVDLRKVCAIVNGALAHAVRPPESRPDLAVNHV
jgi:dTDP-4-amino-4,6-dideoxygalactose transaminase